MYVILEVQEVTEGYVQSCLGLYESCRQGGHTIDHSCSHKLQNKQFDHQERTLVSSSDTSILQSIADFYLE
jgi:hypothetical protein